MKCHFITKDSRGRGLVLFCLYFSSLVYHCKSGIISHGLCIDSNSSLFSELVMCKSCLKHRLCIWQYKHF